jgi:hypothetical protein
MPTLQELVHKALQTNGIQQASGVKLNYPDGSSFTIHSDDHPALRQPVAENNQPTITPVQSAQGGM